MPKSATLLMTCTTAEGIVGPPGEPRANANAPSFSRIVGAIDDCGRLPGAMMLASPCTKPHVFGARSFEVKSSISSLRMMPVPLATTPEPKESLRVNVLVTTLPSVSMTTKCVVFCDSFGNSPGPIGVALLASIVCRRASAKLRDVSVATGTFVNAGSPTYCVPAHRAEVVAAEHVEHLEQRDASARRRRHGDDVVAAIVATQRDAQLRFVVREIGGGDEAAVRAHVGDDAPRGFARVEVARISGDARQCGRELRLHEALAGGHVSEDAPAFVKVLDAFAMGFARRARGEHVADDESFRGELARRRDERAPRELAVFLVRECEAGHGARHRARFGADRRRAFDDVAVGVEVHVARGRGRRGFAIVDRFESAARIAHEHETAAAQIPRLGPHDRERQRRGDSRVDGIAALLHHINADTRGDLADGDDHPMPRDERLPRRGGRGGSDEQEDRGKFAHRVEST
jgi:hypothetical protein